MSDSNAANNDRENKQNLPQFDRWSLILSCTVEDGGQEEDRSPRLKVEEMFLNTSIWTKLQIRNLGDLLLWCRWNATVR